MRRRSFLGLFLALTAGCAKSNPVEAPVTKAKEEKSSEVVKIPYERWSTVPQLSECGCWSLLGKDECGPYKEMSEWLMKRFHFRKDEFKDKVVVDIGCGPTGRLEWLEGSFVAIEPLGTALRRLPWAHMEKYHKIYDQPAEKRIDELVGKVDMIFSLNCLDHAYDLEAIISNVAAYLKPGGQAFISVDVDKSPKEDDTHPLIIRHETMRSMFHKHGLTIVNEEQGNVADSGDGKARTGLPAWYRGTAYNWWLSKPAR